MEQNGQGLAVLERPTTPVPPVAFFEAEVRRAERQLLRLATSLMGSEIDAWDAVQEALIRAYTKLDQFRGDSQFSTWLIRILYRTCYDELRRRSRRPLPWDQGNLEGRGELLSSEGVPGPSGSRRTREDAAGIGGLPGPMVAALPDPAEQLERREVQRWVRHAVGRLEPPFRAVVELWDLEGRSYEEIARVLGLPTGTVKSRLNRARTRLREHLARHSA